MSTTNILKQDELGRVRVTTQRADELVAEYQRSGLIPFTLNNWYILLTLNQVRVKKAMYVT
jgi:hypothetical protein